jgi:hypothetical protein
MNATRSEGEVVGIGLFPSDMAVAYLDAVFEREMKGRYVVLKVALLVYCWIVPDAR